MKQLSAEDAFFFYIETPQQHQHTLGVLLLDPTDAGNKFSVEKLVKKMEDDIDVLPDFRQKLHSLPLYMAPPALVDDPKFKFEDHVNVHTLPKPGSRKQLCKLLDEISSTPLNKKKPLWEAWYIDGLEDGMVACATKSHHCMSDGVQGAEFMAEQFDFEAHPKAKKKNAEKKDAWQAERLSLFNVMSKSWQHHRKTQPGFGNMLSKTIKTFTGRRKVFKASEKARDLVPAMFASAPTLKFNGAIGPERSVALGKLPMADLKKIKNKYGVTFNDVVLTSCALSLRKMLIATDDLPDQPLTVAVPVSLKLKGAEANEGQGNQVGNMLVKLPVQIKDPVKCLRAVHESTVEAKKIFDSSFENLMLGYIGLVPPSLANLAMKTFMGNFVMRNMPTMANLVVSNFPGPPIPLYMLGARLDATYPIGPVMAGQGLNMTFMSGVDDLDFSVHAAKDKIPDVWDLAEGVIAACQQLLEAETAEKPKSKSASATKAVKAASSSASKKQPGSRKPESAAKAAAKTNKAKAQTRKSKTQASKAKSQTSKAKAQPSKAAGSAKTPTAKTGSKSSAAKKRVTRSKNAPPAAKRKKTAAKKNTAIN